MMTKIEKKASSYIVKKIFYSVLTDCSLLIICVLSSKETSIKFALVSFTRVIMGYYFYIFVLITAGNKKYYSIKYF